jgi:hypothetical protein
MRAWRESKNTDMQSTRLKFMDAKDALLTFIEMQQTMHSPQGYDYSDAQGSDSTGESFGIDEFLTLKSALQEASRDVDYGMWANYIEHVVHDRPLHTMNEPDGRTGRTRMAIVKRAIEGVLRKRNMLLVKLEAV